MLLLQLVLHSSECECQCSVFLCLLGFAGSTPVASFCPWGLRRDQRRQEGEQLCFVDSREHCSCSHTRGYRHNPIQCPSFMSDGRLLGPSCPFPGPMGASPALEQAGLGSGCMAREPGHADVSGVDCTNLNS